MGMQSADWDPIEKVYVKRIVKQIIIACGCYNQDTDEYINQCGTENCPLLSQRDLFESNGHRMKEFFTGKVEEENPK